ncbi:MAG: PrsW family glutamic-type intramembrane protease [Anaerolineales bacterium]
MNQTPQQSKFDWLTAAQFIFSILTGLLLMGSFLAGSLVIILGDSVIGIPITEGQQGSSLLFVAGVGFAGILLIPSIYHSGIRLFRGFPRRKISWKGSNWLVFTLPVFIFLGYLSQANISWGRITLPVFHVLTNGAGIFWLLSLARRKLPEENAQRFWGVFGSGLTLAPLITIVVEIFILIIFGILWWLILETQPELQQELLSLADRLQQSSITPAIFENTLTKILESPGITGTIFIYIAAIVPLVEELIKPVVIWFLLSRNPSPWEGFLLGTAAGAGYALFENLAIAADAEAWTFVVISRIGTSAIHILNTGLVGWGLASAWTEKRYFRFLMSLVAAVSLHGIWNGLNVFTALAEFPVIQAGLGPFGSQFAGYAPVGLVILALGSIAGLIWSNSRFQRAIMTQINDKK